MRKQITPRELSQQAQQIIRHTYLIGSAPADPHKILTDLARSVTIFGEMLQNLADRYGQAGRKLASWIAISGKLFWGMIEISVPTSVLRYLFRNWLSLFALISIITIAVGAFTGTSGMSGIGVSMLAAVILLALFSGLLRYYMLKARIPPHLLGIVRLGVALLLLLLFTYLAVYQGDRIVNILCSLEVFFRWTVKLKS